MFVLANRSMDVFVMGRYDGSVIDAKPLAELHSMVTPLRITDPPLDHHSVCQG